MFCVHNVWGWFSEGSKKTEKCASGKSFKGVVKYDVDKLFKPASENLLLIFFQK